MCAKYVLTTASLNERLARQEQVLIEMEAGTRNLKQSLDVRCEEFKKKMHDQTVDFGNMIISTVEAALKRDTKLRAGTDDFVSDGLRMLERKLVSLEERFKNLVSNGLPHNANDAKSVEDIGNKSVENDTTSEQLNLEPLDELVEDCDDDFDLRPLDGNRRGSCGLPPCTVLPPYHAEYAENSNATHGLGCKYVSPWEFFDIADLIQVGATCTTAFKARTKILTGRDVEVHADTIHKRSDDFSVSEEDAGNGRPWYIGALGHQVME